MAGNSEAPLEHLVHPAVCKTVRMIADRLHVLEPTFFANGAEVGGVRERALGSPTHPLAHRGAWRRKTGRGSSAPPLLCWKNAVRPEAKLQTDVLEITRTKSQHIFYCALAVEALYPRVAVVPAIRTSFFVETPRIS